LIHRAWAMVAAMLLAACAQVPVEAPLAATPDTEAPIRILRPEGTGPFPAVVLLHDCSGLGPRSSGAPGRWAKELLSQGYVVAIPDSFSTRGFASGVCSDPSPSRADVGPFRRVRDAYAALERLRAEPGVRGDRIGVMGGSHGGSTVLATIALLARDAPLLAERKRHGFAAAIALYPACAIGSPSFTREYHPAAPLLILAGGLDDWTPAAPCQQLASASAGKAEIKVYPDAHHSFDSKAPVRYLESRNNANAPGGKGATTGGNAEAWKDSIQQVDAFFAKHLKRP
jgi:dienelactone hydrolase